MASAKRGKGAASAISAAGLPQAVRGHGGGAGSNCCVWRRVDADRQRQPAAVVALGLAAQVQHAVHRRPSGSHRVPHGRHRRGHDLPGETGALSHVSLRNHPQVYNEPLVFAAVCVKGSGGKPNVARVVEGPVPGWKLFGPPDTGNGAGGKSYGLPRFQFAEFTTRFPFAAIDLRDPKVPLQAQITGWSPFEPGDPDDASLPVAALEYRFTNPTRGAVDAVFSFNARNFMGVNGGKTAVRPVDGGFVLWGGPPEGQPWQEGAFAAAVTEQGAKVNHAWFRGAWFDALTLAWKDVQDGNVVDRAPVTEGEPSPGASLFVPFKLGPGESKTIAVRLAWYSGETNLRIGEDLKDAPPVPGRYRPWYTSRFADIEEVAAFWKERYADLRHASARFSDCFYDTTLPPEVIEAVAANLTISSRRPCCAKRTAGSGAGRAAPTTTAAATAPARMYGTTRRRFPTSSRALSARCAKPNSAVAGRARSPGLPRRPADSPRRSRLPCRRRRPTRRHHEGLSRMAHQRRHGVAAQALAARCRQSLDYCIETWDPDHKGVVEEPHHNTYDIEFWGPDGMCTSFYLGALDSRGEMGKALGDDVTQYQIAAQRRARRIAEKELFNGEYFIQKIEWTGLRAANPLEMKSFGGGYSPEAVALFEKEGPKYQYGDRLPVRRRSRLLDGEGVRRRAGAGPRQGGEPPEVHPPLQPEEGPLRLTRTRSAPPTRRRSEGGLLLCTWPKGGDLSLPFVYSNEVWTGIEYQAASHMIAMGLVKEGLEVVRTCRDRYDGSVRNPFNEYECGHWYARAMSATPCSRRAHRRPLRRN